MKAPNHAKKLHILHAQPGSLSQKLLAAMNQWFHALYVKIMNERGMYQDFQKCFPRNFIPQEQKKKKRSFYFLSCYYVSGNMLNIYSILSFSDKHNFIPILLRLNEVD